MTLCERCEELAKKIVSRLKGNEVWLDAEIIEAELEMFALSIRDEVLEEAVKKAKWALITRNDVIANIDGLKGTPK